MRARVTCILGVVLLASGLAASRLALAASALPATAIAQFVADPPALLAQYPDGGGGLIARIRDLAASDPSTLNPIIDLLATANPSQTNAIGTGLGQAALAVVKTDQSYAATIQAALVAATDKSTKPTELGSAQPKIGNTVTTENQVEGTTERGTQPLASGTGVYLNELVRTGVSSKAEFVFSDHTNLTLAPVTEINLDQFVYNPGEHGKVFVVARTGAFRFITGVQPHEDYAIKTPFATMGVRGTEFIALISRDNVRIQLNSGAVIVTTISNKVVQLTIPGSVLLVDAYGNTQDEPPTHQPLVNFADLGPPVTNTQLAGALDAFSAVTGNSSVGAAGGGGGGEGGTGSGGTGTGGGVLLGSATPNFSTATVTMPDSFQLPTVQSPIFQSSTLQSPTFQSSTFQSPTVSVTLPTSGSTSGGGGSPPTTPPTVSQSVSPSR